LRHSSFTGIPASAWRMNPMICSSVNLLFFMPVILLVDGPRKPSAGTGGRGQVKEYQAALANIKEQT
jgi:hypothetical protein